jgi:multidrug resistance efflux pump
VNLSSKLGRTFAGIGIVGLVVAGFMHLPTSNSQSVDRTNDLPLVPPIVSSDPTSAQAALEQKQPVQLNSAQITLKQAEVAVSLSQAQLAQARINLAEFTAKHNSAKILSAQGKVSRKEADLALASYKLAQLQHSSASIGLQDSKTQLIAAKAQVSKLGCQSNSGTDL